jgi:2-keto-3-deoxy-L-fuconate dehydrogenase
MSRRLEKKIAVITGATQGIGREIALAFAREGARVWATGRTVEKLAGLEGAPGTEVVELDVTRKGDIEQAARRIGAVDVLVNCAGVVPMDRLENCRDADFERALDVNVRGPFHMMQAFITGMCERSGSSIVNVASVLSSITSVPNRFAYTMSKAALIGMTKSVAAEYAGRGVRCNALCPGAVDTEGLRERIWNGPEPEVTWRAMENRHPVGRVGTTDEIAAACVFLASDESAFMTGQLIVLDGGMTL